MSRGRLLLGVIIIALGVVALLNGLNVTELSFGKVIADFWPLLLIFWATAFLMERTGAGGKIIGGVIFLLGVGFLGNNLGWFTFNFGLVMRLFWPLLLILLGVVFLFGVRGGRSNVAIMGAIERKNTWNLENSGYLAFMGGIHLDVRQAIVPEQVITINVTGFMGGIDIVVPPDLAVICEGTAVLGGVDFFGRGSGGIVGGMRAEQGDIKGNKVLRINCFCALGGINVKTAAIGEPINW